MIKSKIVFGLLFSLIFFHKIDATAQQNTKIEPENVKIFPLPKEGFKKVYIELQPQTNESDFQIEIYAGKNAAIDCNKYTLVGQFLEQNLSGWGYNYFEFESNGELRSTFMACPENEKHLSFVKSVSKLVRYNSKLPIVIYVPDSIDVKYKIWERQNLEYNAIESSN